MKYRFRIILNSINEGDFFTDGYICGRIENRILTSDNRILFDIRLGNASLLRVTFFKSEHTILRMI